MVKFCCAPECNEKFVKGGIITFHSFPVEEKRRKEWEDSLGRENFKASNYSQICSKHFEQKCFDKKRFGGTWLKSDAVPTIFDFSEEALSKIEAPKSPTPPPDELTSNSCGQSKEKRKYYLGDFVEEDMDSPIHARRILELANEEHTLKTATIKKLRQEKARLAKTVATLRRLLQDAENKLSVAESPESILGSSGTAVKEVQDPSPIEPTVKIKEEPADDYLNPSTSNDTANEEFILPHKVDFCTTTDSVVEPQFTLSVASLAPSNEPEPPDCEQPKKKQRTNGPQSPVHNFEKISNPDSSKEHRKDPFDAFGEYIASELRSLDRMSSTVSQKAIGDIILEAKMGKLLNQTQNSKS